MSETIKIRRGAFADLPTLEQSEMGYCTDTDQVFIGDGSANHEFDTGSVGIYSNVASATPVTGNMPSAADYIGIPYTIRKTDDNNNLITLAAIGTDKFNYPNRTGPLQTTYPRLNTPNARVRFISDGSNWNCIAEDAGEVPDAYAYLSTWQENFVSGVWTQVTLDTESYDIGGHFDTGTSKFVAPIPGVYQINAMCVLARYSATATRRVVDSIYVNGVSAIFGNYQTVTDDYFSLPVWTRIDLDKGDYVELFFKSETGADTVDLNYGSKETKMHIWLVDKE